MQAAARPPPLGTQIKLPPSVKAGEKPSRQRVARSAQRASAVLSAQACAPAQKGPGKRVGGEEGAGLRATATQDGSHHGLG